MPTEPAGCDPGRIDEQSGGLATDWCPRETLYSESYVPGSEPTEFCPLHGPGLLGVPYRPPTSDTLSDELLGRDPAPAPADTERVRVNPRFRF